MPIPTSLKDRLSAIEKQFNNRPKQMSAIERAALESEARKLVEDFRKSRQVEREAEAQRVADVSRKLHHNLHEPTPLPPQSITDPELPLDEFATWCESNEQLWLGEHYED